MGSTLRKSLKTIEEYKTANPHYTDLLDIMADILILREEYRRKMTKPIFSVEDKLIPGKMAGGLPLIDLAGKKYDLTRPKEYFDSLIAIAEKRMPAEAGRVLDIIKHEQFDWEAIIRDSFNPAPAGEELPEIEPREAGGREEHIDLIDLFIEESLRPELEVVAEKYGALVEKSGWTEGYISSAISAGINGTSAGSNARSAGMKNSTHWRTLPWKARKATGWTSATSAAATSKSSSCPSLPRK